MSKISVYYDADATEELWGKTTYNLKKDLKKISENELKDIAVEIGNEIQKGIERPPITSAIYWGIKRKATYAKIRVADGSRDAGKSGGYRCIVLVDYVHNSAFLLHIYRHGQGKDNELSNRDKNKLRKLVDEYVDSLEK